MGPCNRLFCLILSFVLLAAACTRSGQQSGNDGDKTVPLPYREQPGEPLVIPEDRWQGAGKLVIQNATILTATGKTYSTGFILVEDGRITQVGEGEGQAEGAQVIDAKGKYVTPGIIDTHSHIGVYAMPSAIAHGDGNEMTKPSTAEVWAEHSFWPHDPAIWRAVAGGVTTIQVLPGSANLIGGRSVTLSLIPDSSVNQMKFPDAKQGLKMACGENPKRVYGSKGGPSTRMGNVAGFRRYFQQAFEYQQEMQRFDRDLEHWQARRAAIKGDDDAALKKLGDAPKAPKRDHALDTLVAAMNDEILVHIHCYRADEMEIMMDLANTYKFKIRSFHHAVEAYKLRERLAAENVSVSIWTDWWGFKMEAFDGITYNPALVHDAGGRVIIHSDSPEDIRFLNVEAAKARAAGTLLGIELDDEELLKWITLNAAWALGIDDQVGSIEPGKYADLVIWDRHPFSSYAKAEKVYIRGKMVFDRITQTFALGDFEKGIRTYGLGDRGNAEKPEPGQGIPSLKPSKAQIPNAALHQDFAIKNVLAELGNGERLEAATIVIRQGKIAAIGPTANTSIPDGLTVMDAEGMVVTPGLIEMQSELGLVVVDGEMQAQDHNSGGGMKPGFHAIEGFDPFSLRGPIEREQGITSVVVRPTGGMISGVGQLVDMRQSMQALESRAKPVMFADMRSWEGSRGSFWLQLREALDDAKLYMEQLRSERKTPLAQQLSLKPVHLEALIGVLKGETILAMSGHRLSDVHATLRFKEEMRKKGHNLQLAIIGGSESWMAAEELAKEKIPVLVTPTKQLPYSLDQLRVRDDNTTLLAEAGVELILTSSDRNIRRLRQQAGRAVAYGMPYSKAIESITGTPARVLGLSDRGTLEPGKRADLVLWTGDPLENHSHAAKIWIAGEEQDLDNRQRMLSRTYHKSAVTH
ncbi:MAG: amidohydrolase family protein [Oligoflexus sp.]